MLGHSFRYFISACPFRRRFRGDEIMSRSIGIPFDFLQSRVRCTFCRRFNGVKILPLSIDMLRAVAWLTNAVAVIIGLVMFVCASGELGI